jgi:hypothetical protein
VRFGSFEELEFGAPLCVVVGGEQELAWWFGETGQQWAFCVIPFRETIDLTDHNTREDRPDRKMGKECG